MTLAAGGAEASVRRARTLAELTTIYEDGVEAVVLERRLSPDLSTEAALFARARRRELLTWRRGVPRTVAEAPALAGDLALLAEVLADLVDCDEVGIRAQVLEAPMCPNWHVDRVELRLVTTYIGPGSELAAAGDVVRARLGASGALRRGAAPIRAHTGDVVLLKGEVWEGNLGRGVVHRSPAHAGPRLVVTMDPLA